MSSLAKVPEFDMLMSTHSSFGFLGLLHPTIRIAVITEIKQIVFFMIIGFIRTKYKYLILNYVRLNYFISTKITTKIKPKLILKQVFLFIYLINIKSVY